MRGSKCTSIAPGAQQQIGAQLRFPLVRGMHVSGSNWARWIFNITKVNSLKMQ